MRNNNKSVGISLALLLPLFMAACEGDDGATGPAGTAGAPGGDGADGGTALVVQTPLAVGSASCPNGGLQIDSGTDLNADGVLDAGEISQTSTLCNAATASVFNRVSSFLVCTQIDPACDTDTETAAEIVTASEDGSKLIYTDSPGGVIGFVDLTDPAAPTAMGTTDVSGEPTSVAVAGNLAVVGVNTSPDFVNPSGNLAVVDVGTQAVVGTVTLAGQPDSVAVSPDGAYAAIVIENERDEDLAATGGAPPQLPAGSLQIVDLSGPVAGWTATTVDLTGIATLFPTDPEPEYVDINTDNVAVVTLQENNHIVLVDLATGTVSGNFSAGSVDLMGIDATEGEGDADKNRILQNEMLMSVPREPDGVTWINTTLFATADEGDLDGGSRGFTIFNTSGDVVFTSGNQNDRLTARLGHYPDERSGNKGNEPENAELGNYGGNELLIVASERSSLLFVYDVNDPVQPKLLQILPAGTGPEGVYALTSRNLLIAASEEDARDNQIRSVVNVYRYELADPTYPSLVSADRADGSPIPWGALSGLAADINEPDHLLAIEDSFYGENRIFRIDISRSPAEIVEEIRILDSGGVFAAVPAAALADTAVPEDDPTRVDVFDEVDLDLLINADNTVNIDPEGIAAATAGGFWIASEGAGGVGDRPVNSQNFIFKTDAAGVIEAVVTLPDALNAQQRRFGFEGIAEYNGAAYVTFQREWPLAGDTDSARIGVYDLTAASWIFLNYPLDAVESQDGGWVGLSDITSLGNGEFLVVERDNKAGPDAAIKRLYRFDATGLADGDPIVKTLVRDLVPDLTATGGLVVDKVEGSAVTQSGDVWIVNDNDGVDDSSGETRLINLGPIL
ncbi:MAG: esterase-like activity of phytase family protein [Pseudomonadota bacterium]